MHIKISSDGEILRKRQHNIFHYAFGIFEERFLVKPDCKSTESTPESENGMEHVSLNKNLIVCSLTLNYLNLN